MKEVLHVKQRCSFSFKSKLSGFRAGHFNILSCFLGDVFHSREVIKIIRDFSLGVIFVCYDINYINNLTSGAF